MEDLPRRERRFPLVIILAFVFLGLVFMIFLFADWLAPFDYRSQNLLNRLKPPSFMGGDPRHLLGTDELGRDTLSRLIYAVRFSVLVALAGTSIGAVLGTFLGFVAAHFRGFVEEGIMMLVDAQASLPFILIVLAVVAFFGGGFGLFILLMGIHGWEVFARLTRALVVSANSHGYAVALRSLGAGSQRIYLRHMLPNMLSVLVVQFTLSFPGAILLETSLSFLGLGIRPPLTSLGQMLGAGRAHMLTAWWMAVLPGSLIFLTTLSISLVGDWLRDRLDPMLSGR
jgi:peptide/nickel transport system permease protein